MTEMSRVDLTEMRSERIRSVVGPFGEVLLGVVILVDDLLVEIEVLPLVYVEILEFVIFSSHPDLVSLVVVQSLAHSVSRKKYKFLPACNCNRSSMML